MQAFSGTYTVSVDGKGRVAIPSKIRSIATLNGSEKFQLIQNVDGCLDLYTEAGFQILAEKLTPQQAFDDEEARRIKRFVYGSSAEAIPDSQGRITIPRNMLDYAGISKEIVMISAGERVELWDPQAHVKHEASYETEIKVVLENYIRKQKNQQS